MTLKFIFSKNKKIGSKIISFFSSLILKELDKIPSHGCILIQRENKKDLIFESTLESGVRLISYEIWLANNEICYTIDPNKNYDSKYIINIIKKLRGKKYDYLGILFFALCFFNHLVFKLPFPKKNKWQNSNKYFCLEAMFEICEYEKSGMATPAKMCLDLIKRHNGKN